MMHAYVHDDFKGARLPSCACQTREDLQHVCVFIIIIILARRKRNANL